MLYAQNQVAQQFKEQGGFEGTPSVSIKGFPFLTQVIAHNIHEITITSDKIKAGPVTITNLERRHHRREAERRASPRARSATWTARR